MQCKKYVIKHILYMCICWLFTYADVALKKIKRIVNFLQKYREIGFNSTKTAITEIASTTDAEPK
jgi:hypothetical protein